MRDSIQTGATVIDPALIAYDATLDRVFVSVVTSLKNLNLGVLGGQLTIDEELPDHLDFDYYVTGDPVIHQVVQEAQALGLQFQDEARLIQAGDVSKMRRLNQSRELAVVGRDRQQQIEMLATATGSCRYDLINIGPTGRVSHERLVFGLYSRFLAKVNAPGARQKLNDALESPGSIRYALEVDLASGVTEIHLKEPKLKGLLECPALSIAAYASKAAHISVIPDIMHDLKRFMVEFLDFSQIIPSTTSEWNATAFTYLVVRGWWWSKHLIHDYPLVLYVPSHADYFFAMAGIGATMMHLEQASGCVITTNELFDALRLLTNIGSTNQSISREVLTYAAQGPGGPIVHDVLSTGHSGWSSNPYLSFQWLKGKFTGVPETALFGHAPKHLKEAPTPALVQGDDLQDDAEPSLTIFADSTDGHTLRCAVVDSSRTIRSIPFSRALCGLMLAYIGNVADCRHSTLEPEVLNGKQVLSVPWSTLLKHYYGQAELPEEDIIIVTGIGHSKMCQVLTLGASSLGTAIDAGGCVHCAFERSQHVVRLPPGGLAGSTPFTLT